MQQNGNPPSSNVGLAAAILGGLAVAGTAVAVAASSGKKSRPGLGGARRPIKLKKPCGCGR